MASLSTSVPAASFEDAAAITAFVTENTLGSDCLSSSPSQWLRGAFKLEGDKLTVSGRGVSLTAVAHEGRFLLPPAESSKTSEMIDIGKGTDARCRMIHALIDRNPTKFNY